MREMIVASRSEKECVEYSYSEDAMEPGLIRVKEIWTSREALRLHFQSDHMKKWRSTWEALQIFDRRLVLYQVGDPEPI
jgi:quinol monooxygenase YgiN